MLVVVLLLAYFTGAWATRSPGHFDPTGAFSPAQRQPCQPVIPTPRRSSLQDTTTSVLGDGQYRQLGPIGASGPVTLGYRISSNSTFNVYVMNSANLLLFQSGGVFSYFNGYSRTRTTNATLPQVTTVPPEPVYLVLVQTSLLSMTYQATIAFFDGSCQVACSNGLCSSPLQCSCFAGWSGTTCDLPVCERPCLNGGTCVAPNSCSCPPLVDGTQCETPVVVSDYWVSTTCTGTPAARGIYALDTCYPDNGGASIMVSLGGAESRCLTSVLRVSVSSKLGQRKADPHLILRQ